MSNMEVERTTVDVPLLLTIRQGGVGGVIGQTPTVAIRDGGNTNSYLDFNDNVFKVGGWVLKYGAMVETERGHYQRPFNVAVLTLDPGRVLVAEYHVDDGGDVVGDAHDTITIVAHGADTSLVRKAITNRQEEAPGLPGTLILYDDDDVTPIVDQELRDNNDGSIAAATGVPAKRSRSLI